MLQIVKKKMNKRIVVIGPESTGKSTLCEKIAVYYKTIWVKEYAREYLLKNGTDYTFDNLLDIAKGQLQLEDTAAQSLSNEELPIIIDTDMYVIKVWCEFVFGKTHNWILNRIVERKYDLYLLCNTDLPWVKDELREYPDLVTREKLYHHYKDALVNQQVSWVNISGGHEERLRKAIAAINALH
jgi:NadR type nicotinamide-nucleotide adenylyltransferase